jgi:hypothetical protein
MRFPCRRTLFAAALLPVLILALTGSGCIAGDANGSEEPPEESAPPSPQECKVASVQREEFRLDLDEDGQSDFLAWSEAGMTLGGPDGRGTGHVTLKICSEGRNEVVTGSEANWITPLEEEARIGARLPDSLQWSAETTKLYGRWLRHGRSPHDYGPWPETVDGYVGLKLSDAGGQGARYGWARVRVDTSLSSTNRATVEDYALSPEPGEPIRAGEQP